MGDRALVSRIAKHDHAGGARFSGRSAQITNIGGPSVVPSAHTPATGHGEMVRLDTGATVLCNVCSGVEV